MKNQNGQALIEMIAFAVAAAILLAMFGSFTKQMMIREKLLCAAREGALLYSSGALPKIAVEQRLRDYLCNTVPNLPTGGIQVSVGSLPGATSWLLELDEIRVSYTRSRAWAELPGLDRRIEEKCVIKHAPRYGIPLQTFYGPRYLWNEG